MSDWPEVYGAPLNFNPNVLRNQVVVPGELLVYGFTVFSTNAGAQFVQVFDSAGTPASGAVPIFPLDVASNTLRGVSWAPNGRAFPFGITLATSSTAATFTANATADTFFDIQYDFVPYQPEQQ